MPIVLWLFLRFHPLFAHLEPPFPRMYFAAWTRRSSSSRPSVKRKREKKERRRRRRRRSGALFSSKVCASISLPSHVQTVFWFVLSYFFFFSLLKDTAASSTGPPRKYFSHFFFFFKYINALILFVLFFVLTFAGPYSQSGFCICVCDWKKNKQKNKLVMRF